MGDDTCRPHAHYGGDKRYTCHHFFPIAGNEWKCMCGARRQSVISRDVARKYRDRVEP